MQENKKLIIKRAAKTAAFTVAGGVAFIALGGTAVLLSILAKILPKTALYGRLILSTASAAGPAVTIPFAGGKLLTGEYQQVVLVDFDTRPRKRVVIATVL